MVSGVKKPSTSSEIALPSSLPISSTGCLRRCYTSGDYTRGPQGGSALAQASSYEREVLCFSTDGRADDSPGSSVARCSRVLICRCSSSAWAVRFGGRGPYHEHGSGAVRLCSSKLWRWVTAAADRAVAVLREDHPQEPPLDGSGVPGRHLAHASGTLALPLPSASHRQAMEVSWPTRLCSLPYGPSRFPACAVQCGAHMRAVRQRQLCPACTRTCSSSSVAVQYAGVGLQRGARVRAVHDDG